MGYDHVWFWRTRLPERKGQRCRVLVRGRKNSIAIEFEDGTRVCTSRHAVRPYEAPDERQLSLFGETP
jgi:hypothetical protein